MIVYKAGILYRTDGSSQSECHKSMIHMVITSGCSLDCRGLVNFGDSEILVARAQHGPCHGGRHPGGQRVSTGRDTSACWLAESLCTVCIRQVCHLQATLLHKSKAASRFFATPHACTGSKLAHLQAACLLAAHSSARWQVQCHPGYRSCCCLPSLPRYQLAFRQRTRKTTMAWTATSMKK